METLTAPRPGTSSHRWQALAVTAVALGIVGLDTTVLGVALPTLAKDLGASTSQLQWIADAYLLALAALLLPGGMIGDRYGRKRAMLVALSIFGGASLWCAYAGSPGSLIAARALLGVGAALLTPLTFSLLVLLFAPEERARAMGVLGAAAVIGMPLGPIVGGWLLDRYWWGSVFLLNVPFVVAALVGCAVLVPSERPGPRPPMDVVGTGLSAAGLCGVVFGLIEGPGRGWSSPVVVAALAAGLVALGGFGRWERRLTGAEPVLDRSLWRVPEFRWGALAASAATLVGFVALFSTPLYLQGVLGADELGTGLRLLPLLGGMLAGIGVGVRGAALTGPRAPTVLGFAAVVAGAGLGARTTIGSGYGWTAAWLTVVGFGFGAVMIVGQNLAVDTLSRQRAGAGGALVQVLRQVAGALGIAALGSLLNAVYRASVDVEGLPGAAAQAVRGSVQGGLAVAARTADPALARSVRQAFLDGLHAQLWASAAIAAVAIAVTLWKLPDTRPAARDDAAPAAAGPTQP